MKKFKNLSFPGGGVKKYFFEIGCERLFMSHLIIVFNNNVFGFFSKTWTYRAYKIVCLMFSN